MVLLTDIVCLEPRCKIILILIHMYVHRQLFDVAQASIIRIRVVYF